MQKEGQKDTDVITKVSPDIALPPATEIDLKVEILTDSPYSSLLLTLFVLNGDLPEEYLTLNDKDKKNDSDEIKSAKVYAIELQKLTESMLTIEQGNPNDRFILGNNIRIRSMALQLFIKANYELLDAGIVQEMKAGQERLKMHMYDDSIFIRHTTRIDKDGKYLNDIHMLERQLTFYQLAVKFFNASSDIDCYLLGDIPESFYTNTLDKKFKNTITRNGLQILYINGIGKLRDNKRAASVFLEILKKEGNSTQQNPLAKTSVGIEQDGKLQFEDQPEIRNRKLVQKLDIDPLPDDATAVEKANRVALVTKIVSYGIMTPSVFEVIQENTFTLSDLLKDFTEVASTIDPSKREELALEARITTQMLIEINKDLVVNEEKSLKGFESSGLLTNQQVQEYKIETKSIIHPDEKFIALIKVLTGKENYSTFVQKLLILEPSLLAEVLFIQNLPFKKKGEGALEYYERMCEVKEDSLETIKYLEIEKSLKQESIKWGFQDDFNTRVSKGSWVGI